MTGRSFDKAEPHLAKALSQDTGSAPNGGEERIRQARNVTAAAVKADNDTYEAADVGTEPRDPSRTEASARACAGLDTDPPLCRGKCGTAAS